jgi:rhamnose transport system ATP-binding protein
LGKALVAYNGIPNDGDEQQGRVVTGFPASAQEVPASAGPIKRRRGQAPIMRLLGIEKVYPGVVALKGVDLDVYDSEVHAVVGENGAGKSTLLKIACGALTQSAGKIELEDRGIEFGHPSEARAAGVVAVYQELTIIPGLSAMANVFLGREKRKWGFLRRDAMLKDYDALQEQLDVDIDPDQPAGRLSISDQQSLEIMRGLAADAKILILDEPTASIGLHEREALYSTVQKLRSRDVAILLISHDLDEVLYLSDQITVLREGQKTGSQRRDKWTKDTLVGAMLGERRSKEIAAKRASTWEGSQEKLLEVSNVCVPGKVQSVSFNVKRGEIVGIAGLVGAGRTELLRAMVGMEPGSSGKLRIRGRELGWPSNPRAARELGIALAPEDRKRQGLVLGLPSYANVTLPNPWKGSRAGFLSPRNEMKMARPVTERLGLQKGALKRDARTLSGGNQQKLVLAKWLEMNMAVFLVDEPTRGVDIGAKVELFSVLEDMARSGVAVVMVSSEIEEVIDHSDRVLVLSRGRLIGEVEGRTTTKDDVIKMIFAAEPESARQHA